jgi:hypothetical protein
VWHLIFEEDLLEELNSSFTEVYLDIKFTAIEGGMIDEKEW